MEARVLNNLIFAFSVCTFICIVSATPGNETVTTNYIPTANLTTIAVTTPPEESTTEANVTTATPVNGTTSGESTTEVVATTNTSNPTTTPTTTTASETTVNVTSIMTTALLTTIDYGNCTNVTCGTEHFMCAVSCECINGSKICDGEDDCADGSDEFGCDNSTYTSTTEVITTPPTTPVVCKDWEFRCPGDNICINETKYNDSIIDCPKDCADEPELTFVCSSVTVSPIPMDSNDVTRIIVVCFAVAILLVVLIISAVFVFSKKRNTEANSRFRRLIEDDLPGQPNTESPLYGGDPEPTHIDGVASARVTIMDDDDDDFGSRVRWERGEAEGKQLEDDIVQRTNANESQA